MNRSSQRADGLRTVGYSQRHAQFFRKEPAHTEIVRYTTGKHESLSHTHSPHHRADATCNRTVNPQRHAAAVFASPNE